MQYSRILIIDQNQAEAQYISIQLQVLGYDVSVSPDIKDGFNLVVRELPDLILMQSNGREGVEFCRLIREHTDLPVIALAETSQKCDELKFLDAGADDFLIKPFSIEILSLKMRAILRRRNLIPVRPVVPG